MQVAGGNHRGRGQTDDAAGLERLPGGLADVYVDHAVGLLRGEGQGEWSVQQRPAGVDRRVRFGGQPGRVHLGGDVSRCVAFCRQIGAQIGLDGEIVQLASGVALGVQGAGHARLDGGQIGQGDSPVEVEGLVFQATVGGDVQSLALHHEAGEFDVLAMQRRRNIDTAVLADQGRHRGDAAGDGDAAVRGGGGRAVLHLGGDIEAGAAVEISADRRRQGRKVRQCQVGINSSRPFRAGGAFGGDQGMVQREGHRAVRRIQPCGGGHSDRIGGEQVGFRAGYVKVSNRGVQIDLTFVAGDVGVQRTDPGTGRGKGANLDRAVGVGFEKRTVHLGVHQDRLPGHAWGGRHGGGLGFDRQVGSLVLQVDGAGGGSRQLARGDANLCRRDCLGGH